MDSAFIAQGAFADAWLPVLERWANADFAIMQPMIPDGKSLVVFATTMMLATARQKEQELQGESSGADRVRVENATATLNKERET